jgi:hypothetical protein
MEYWKGTQGSLSEHGMSLDADKAFNITHISAA